MMMRIAHPETTIQSGGSQTFRRVLLVVGDGHVGTYPLHDGRTLVVGRDRDVDVALPHSKISRRHATLHTGERVEVEDLGSKNGTWLAGRRLGDGERTSLDLGMNLQLGPYTAVVLESLGDVSSEAPVRAAIPISDPTPSGIPDVVARIAQGKVSVLITGETGAGKEVLARTIHELSGRGGQFVAINCASLSETLLESELFGHERGAFTGAAASKSGLFEVAAGGTVFLDEIGELPAGIQAKLLRVLETRMVYRVGGVTPVTLDVRFVAATHRDLEAQVASGAFRRDLFFRVNGIVLAIQPLRERRSAIPALARELLAGHMPPGVRPPRLSPEALELLAAHTWPGNVRELRTVMERAAVISDGEEVRAADILIDEAPERAPDAPAAAGPQDGEKARILAALAECAGNQTEAARRLGIARTTLSHKLALHRIPRPQARRLGG
jgi:two-component system response regulator AtoC